ncbi:hypothetical protein HDU96_009965, partial [Phlyctochytrium bullatum]
MRNGLLWSEESPEQDDVMSDGLLGSEEYPEEDIEMGDDFLWSEEYPEQDIEMEYPEQEAEIGDHEILLGAEFLFKQKLIRYRQHGLMKMEEEEKKKPQKTAQKTEIKDVPYKDIY